MARPPSGHVVTRLRPARSEESEVVGDWRADPQTEYEAWGAPPPGVAASESIPKPHGMGELMITDGDDRPIGTVGWHQVLHGPNAGSIALCLPDGVGLRIQAEDNVTASNNFGARGLVRAPGDDTRPAGRHFKDSSDPQIPQLSQIRKQTRS